MRIELPGIGSGAIALVAVGLVAAPAASADPATLVLIERASTDQVIDIGAPGDSTGDVLTFANEVFDAANENRVGSDQGACTRILPGVSWDCRWTLSLSDGQIMVQGPFFDHADSVLAIVGGTGRYADARGEMQLTHIVPDDSSYRFTYRVI
ncbi:MAG: allene oxide cyclase family protein [Mycolicibacterium sp.]|uniref:allene oxide cyclase family protein n=1 Tax=Mycolicibacterium sp. TaxID=2320850 RepID=UPI003D0F122F